jgi:hypothetical protein
MRTADFVRATLATAAAAALATGCTSSTEGAATGTTAPTTTGSVEIFNPCTELSEGAITAAGLDPASKDVTVDPPSGPSTWRVCLWRSEGNEFFVSIFSTSHTLDEARSNQELVNVSETSIVDRNGLTFMDKTDSDGESCYAAMSAAQGMFEINVAWTIDAARNRDICEVAAQYATALEPHLPD